MEHFIKIYKKKKGKDLRKDNRAVQKLRREVEKAKRALSNSHQVKIEVESLYDGEDFTETLTRAKFEELNMDLFRSTMKPVQKVMEDADMQKKDVDEIVLVGGSTRIPKVNYQITWMETYQNLCTRFTFFLYFFYFRFNNWSKSISMERNLPEALILTKLLLMELLYKLESSLEKKVMNNFFFLEKQCSLFS